MSDGFSDLVLGIGRLVELALLALLVIALLVVLGLLHWWWAFWILLSILLVAACVMRAEVCFRTYWRDLHASER